MYLAEKFLQNLHGDFLSGFHRQRLLGGGDVKRTSKTCRQASKAWAFGRHHLANAISWHCGAQDFQYLLLDMEKSENVSSLIWILDTYYSQIIIIIMFRSYIALIKSKWRLYALEALLPPALAPMQPFSAKSIRRNKFLLGNPFTTPGSRETIVDKLPCLWAYAPSGIQTHDPLIRSREHEPINHSAPTLKY